MKELEQQLKKLIDCDIIGGEYAVNEIVKLIESREQKIKDEYEKKIKNAHETKVNMKIPPPPKPPAIRKINENIEFPGKNN